MNKRQANVLASLITATFNGGTDAFDWADSLLSENDKQRVMDATHEQAWRILERHGFTKLPSPAQCLAYALSK